MSEVNCVRIVMRVLAIFIGFYGLEQAISLAQYLRSEQNLLLAKLYVLWVSLIFLSSVAFWVFPKTIFSFFGGGKQIILVAAPAIEVMVVGVGLYFLVESVLDSIYFVGDVLVFGVATGEWGVKREEYLNLIVSVCGVLIGGGMAFCWRRVVRVLQR
ncbi:hypothetical protein [Pseudomonas sp. NBRC 100443]|uniref:hypothetical protein n=1 Tax=Pseudomonas sp. NBRC 100443 TaxID=1113665 RepID=UPI0024A5DED6|nr:hypothetical protein [Pseudomonas sp. NBRC 100443]GLU37221.1 hypothetical protein Pssp01_13140 [Pseudomonas sp. NBRC 100443]